MFTSEEVFVHETIWRENGIVEIQLEGDLNSFIQVNRKDFFHPDREWEKELGTGSCLRLWTTQGSRVAGIEKLDAINNKWESVWFVGNDFPTAEKRKEQEEEYSNFIIEEAKNVTKLIDEGKTYAEIKEAMSDEHTGFTFGTAIFGGISDATNKENAEAVKKAHNASYGSPDAEGVVNPALMTVTTKDEDPEEDDQPEKPEEEKNESGTEDQETEV